jgi:hypothetical protein
MVLLPARVEYIHAIISLFHFPLPPMPHSAIISLFHFPLPSMPHSASPTLPLCLQGHYVVKRPPFPFVSLQLQPPIFFSY